MRHRVGAVLISALTLAVGVGCSRTTQGSAEDRELIYQPDATLNVRVVNHSQFDATIYLLHDGVRERLGTVTAASAADFGVRARSLGNGDFILLADRVGATRASATERLHVSQGTEFIWTLESDFSRSSVLVRG